MGETFTIVKFRTMTDADDEQGRLLPDEVRLTSFGKLLRSTSLDELPELLERAHGGHEPGRPAPAAGEVPPALHLRTGPSTRRAPRHNGVGAGQRAQPSGLARETRDGHLVRRQRIVLAGHEDPDRDRDRRARPARDRHRRARDGPGVHRRNRASSLLAAPEGPCRDADHSRTVDDVLRDDRTGAHDCPCPDGDLGVHCRPRVDSRQVSEGDGAREAHGR